MCACLCACVRVCTRVCALGILLRRLLRAGLSGPAPGPRVRAARPRAHAERGDRAGPQHFLPGGQGGSEAPAHAARPPHPPGPQRKFGFWGSPGLSLSGWPPPAKRGARRLSPRRGGSLPAPRFPGPRTYLAERDVPREGDPVARGSPAGGGRKGALTSARLIPAARGPARGSGPAAAVSEVGGARSPGCGPCRRGGRRWESAALRVRAAAATAASSVGSRRTEPPKPELPTCY